MSTAKIDLVVCFSNRTMFYEMIDLLCVCLGLHFFNPVPIMKLVEIIRMFDGTSDDTYNALKQFCDDIDKVSVECKVCSKFVKVYFFFNSALSYLGYSRFYR